MKLQNIFTSAAMLAIFVLATLNLVIRLAQFVIETVQTVLVAILFVAKIACKMVKATQHLLSSFEWLLSAIQGIFDSIHSSLEDWMVSTIPSDITDNRPTPLLIGANPFPSERTAFEESATTAYSLELAIAPTKTPTLASANPFPLERTAFECHAQSVIANSLELVVAVESEAINSLESIAPKLQTAIASSLELTVAPAKTILMLAPAVPIPSERTVFQHHAISAIALAVAEPDEAISIEVIVEPVTTKPLGKAVTNKAVTNKKSKRELSKLTIPQLRELIVEVAKNNNSLVVPKSKAKKAVLVDWLMTN